MANRLISHLPTNSGRSMRMTIDDEHPHALRPFPWGELTPYMSMVVLECPEDNTSSSFGAVLRELKKGPTTRGRKQAKLISIDEIDLSQDRRIAGIGQLASAGIDQMAGIIREVRSTPSWLTDHSEYVNTSYSVSLAIRRGRLLAVKPEEGIAERFQKWIDKSQRMVQRISPRVLEYTFLMGHAKGLWLHSATGRTSRRPDAKTSVGSELRDTLDVFEDSGYALGAARCELPDNADLVTLQGSIGATLRASQVWLKPMSSLREFIHGVVEAFEMISAAQADKGKITEAFPELAREVTDIGDVSGAYDVSVIDADHLPPGSVTDEDAEQAAAILQDAALNVVPGSRTASFKLDVGLNGTVGGTVSVTPKRKGHGFSLDIGHAGEPSCHEIVHPVFSALDSTDFLSVYYESGHVYSQGRIFRRNNTIFPFNNWKFENFEGYDITLEKPFGHDATAKIHESTGTAVDVSLFGWTLENFNKGWLICDDGSGESADFLHIDYEWTLRIIHIKAAKSKSAGRHVATGAYEVVASQASKNMVFMDTERLAEHLQRTDKPYKASWVDGDRVSDRTEFIEALRERGEGDSREVVIIQPHLRKDMHQKLRTEVSQSSLNHDLLRLQRLETLLNSARASIVKSNAELYVIGSGDI